MPAAVDTRAIALLDEVEQRVDTLVARIVERVRAFDAPDGYAAVPADEIAAATNVLARAALQALREARPPTADELAQADILGERRGRQGVSLEDLLRSFRVAAREAAEVIGEVAATLDVDTATIIRLTADLWDWIDQIAVPVAEAHRRVELAAARRDQQERASVLHGLVHGTLAPHRRDELAAAVGLDPVAEHHVLRIRPSAEHSAEDLERLLIPSLWSTGLVALVGEDLTAILAAPPSTPLPVCAGLGPAVALGALPHSFRDAGRALDAARAFGLEGCVRFDDVLLRAAILTDDGVGARLLARYVDPVRALGDFGEELLHSLRVYVQHQLNVEATARELFVHPNTLRHRLARFEETTGASLRDLEDLAGIWWALTADGQRPQQASGDVR
jgi:putative transposase